ncbi:MAG: DUF1902 domain-containing protein [Blautia sp.]|nr:DUF1902 domain-containing protein [Blautia sp.]
MEYVIRFAYDDEANVWMAFNNIIPLALEADSLDTLMQKIRDITPEILALNSLPPMKNVYFL